MKALVAAALLALLGGGGEDEALPGQRAEQGGIAVEMEFLPAEGAPAGPLREGDARVRFRLSERTGTALTGVYPAAWMDRLKPGEALSGDACVGKVEEFLGGSLFSRPAVDLNVYYVLALNQDATLTVVDPLFGFGGSKLLALVELDSPGEDWMLSADGSRLFVSMPDSDRVAVVETATWRKVASVEVGRRPGRLALHPDGAHLWVALDGAEDGAPSGVAVLDWRRQEVVARIATGRGPHDLALSDDGRHAFVTNRADGTVAVLEAARPAKVGEIEVGPKPASVAYSALARAAYVTSEEAGTITAVPQPGPGAAPVVRIAAEPGLGAVRFAPGGRLAFVVNPARNRLYILDSSRHRIVQRADMDYGPDQVTFSQELAYVRQRGTDIVLMIPLDEVGREGEKVPVADFTGGQNPLGKTSRRSPADSIVRAPGAAAVLVANPADQAIYYYKEGMAAPMGSFANYGREPRALLVVDRSLEERTPGSYETVVRLAQPGRYRVAFFLAAPRTIQCFEVSVAPDPARAAQRLSEQPVKVESRVEGGTPAAGKGTPLRFRLTDPVTGRPRDGVTDVQVLVYRPSGTWHQRQWAREMGDGVYGVDFVPPAEGAYQVAVQAVSQRLAFHRSPPLVLHVTAHASP